MIRPEPLADGEIYHVMNKSIAGFRIFSRPADCRRMAQMLRYFSYDAALPRFSQFIRQANVQQFGFEASLAERVEQRDKQVQIIAQCIMPTHIHVVVKQLTRDGISHWMGNALNAYSRYYNTRSKRKGPLWVGRFKNVRVTTDEQLLHVTRYVHLNAVTAGLVERAADWPHSSYLEYVRPESVEHPLCEFGELFDMTPKQHESFTNDHADYQRQLGKLKNLMLE